MIGPLDGMGLDLRRRQPFGRAPRPNDSLTLLCEEEQAM
jgi:hypothetical protein